MGHQNELDKVKDQEVSLVDLNMKEGWPGPGLFFW